MILIGITGGIGYGKTTFAEALKANESSSRHFESSDIIAEVIDALHAASTSIPLPAALNEINAWLEPLPKILAKVTHCKVEFGQIRISEADVQTQPELYDKLFLYLKKLSSHPELALAKISPENKAIYRPLLQWLGGYMVKKVSAGIWYDELVRRARQAAKQGTELCTISGVRFPSDADAIRAAGGVIIQITRPQLTEQSLNDPTERERIKIKVDVTIINDAGIHELTSTAQHLLADIKFDRLRTKYIASEL